MLSSQVCVKDSNNIEADSDVSLEIPSGTVVAYSILELEIKKDGHYGECVCVTGMVHRSRVGGEHAHVTVIVFINIPQADVQCVLNASLLILCLCTCAPYQCFPLCVLIYGV